MKSVAQKKTYDNIIKLYDFAERLVDSVDEEKDPGRTLAILEPLVDQIEESAETLAHIYLQFAETNEKPGSQVKLQADLALKKLQLAIDKFKKRARAN